MPRLTFLRLVHLLAVASLLLTLLPASLAAAQPFAPLPARRAAPADSREPASFLPADRPTTITLGFTFVTIAWRYDARGNMVLDNRAISGAGSYTTSYGYDAAGRVVTTTYPTGEVITNAYNAAGLLAGARSQSNALWYASGAAYNAAGQLTGLTYGNGVQAAWAYRADNQRLERIQVGGSLLDLRYIYDPVGNVRTITDTSNSGQVITFTYDALDRLTRGYTSGVGQGTYDQSYTYNAIGNIMSATAQGGYGYPAAGGARPHGVITTSVGFSATYDVNGNMLTRIEVLPGGRYTYTQAWDAENRLIRVVGSGVTTTFTYNGDGQRVKVAVGTVVTAYVGSLYEVNAGTGVTTTYYSFGGQRVAMRTASGVTWLSGDHLGSASLATNSAGAKVSDERYLPYGVTRSGSMGTDYQFTGQKKEASTGLYYYGARYYDPVVGRFISADTVVQSGGRQPAAVAPLVVSFTSAGASQARPGRTPSVTDPQFLNWYTYTRNSPLAYVDASGHIAWWVVGGVVGAIGGLGTYYSSHQESFDWQEAALWAGGGAVVGATLGAGAQWVAGAMGAQAAAGAGTAATAVGANVKMLQSTSETTDRLVRTGWTVIGKNGAYQELGKALGAKFLDVPPAEWAALGGSAQKWAKNVEFLDSAIARGDSFRLATKFSQGWLEKGTYFKRELLYLLEKGYELVTDGNGSEWLMKVE